MTAAPAAFDRRVSLCLTPSPYPDIPRKGSDNPISLHKLPLSFPYTRYPVRTLSISLGVQRCHTAPLSFFLSTTSSLVLARLASGEHGEGVTVQLVVFGEESLVT